MKRKIINSVLLLALVVSSVSSFVSCKDYDEDIYVDLRGRLDNEATLREALEAQLNTLKQTVNDLKDQIAAIEQCPCGDMSQYLTSKDLEGLVTSSELNSLINRIAALESAKTLLENRITLIENALATLDGRVTTLEGKVVDLDQQLSAAKSDAEQAKTKAEEALAKAEQALTAAQQGGSGYDDTELRTLISNLTSVVDGLKSTVNNLSDRMQAVEGVAADALNKANAAQATADANARSIVTINEQLATIQDWIKNHKDNPGVEPYDDTEIWRVINCMKTHIKAIEDNYATQDQVKEAKDLADKANAAIASLRDSIANGDIVTLGQLRDSLNNYVTKKEFQDSIKVLRDSIDSFSTRIAAAEAAIQKLTSDIQNMITGIIVQASQNPVLGYLNTPFGVNATALAVYYGDPTDSWYFPERRSGNYVNGLTDFNKWTARNKAVVGGLANVTGALSGEADVRLVTQKDGAETGNAGSLYVTVNPSNVLFAGKELKILDSQDNEAPATLSPLELTDDVLTFGYTRSAQNGFYKAAATISADKVDAAKLQIDYKSLEDDAKAMIKERTKSSVLEMGATLIKNVQNISPAYGLMGTWTDSVKGTEHKTYSQYNVAVAAVRPLSFAFLSDYKVSKMPGVDRVSKLLSEIVDKINVKVNLGLPDFAKYKGSITFKDITLPTISDDMFRITYNKTYTSEDLAGDGKLYGDTSDKDLYFLVTNVKDGRYALVSTAADGTTQKLFIYDPATSSYHQASASEQAAWGAIEFGLTVDVDINKTSDIKQTLQDIIDNLNSEFGASSDLATNITNLLNDVASLGNLNTKINTSISDAKADIKSTINNYMTRLNNKLVSWFNQAPGVLHLALIGGNDNGIGLLSQAKNYPTQASGTLKLVPTTYNLETIAPAYKKYIAVTDVFKADGSYVDGDETTPGDQTKSLASAANGTNMGKVIDSEKTCTLKGQSGYIYEITYTAIDYFGKSSIKKYYVKF